MKCPCGCKRDVPSGRFFVTDKCRRLGNKMGVYMPNRYEKKLRRLKNEKR